MRVAGLNRNGFRRSVRDITDRGADFFYCDTDAGNKTGNRDPPVFIGDKFAVGIADRLSVLIRHEKRGSGNRRCRIRDENLRVERLCGSVAERQSPRVVGVDRDGLRFAVQNISVRGFDFRHDIRAGIESGNRELSVFIRPVNAVRGSPALIGVHSLAFRRRDFELPSDCPIFSRLNCLSERSRKSIHELRCSESEYPAAFRPKYIRPLCESRGL